MKGLALNSSLRDSLSCFRPVRCHYSVSDRLLCSLSIRFILKFPFQISLSGLLFPEPEVLSNFLGLITSHTLVCDASDVFSYLLRFTFDLDVCICGFQGTSSFLAGFISHQNLRTSFLTSDHWSNQLYQQRFPAVSGWHASVGARSIFISTFPCFLFGRWQPPALPHRLQCSTIGRFGLNHRVRDGNGCFPKAHRHQQ